MICSNPRRKLPIPMTSCARPDHGVVHMKNKKKEKREKKNKYRNAFCSPPIKIESEMPSRARAKIKGKTERGV